MVGEGAEVLRRPALARFRDEARELAERGGLRREPRHPARPLVEGGGVRRMVPDSRLHAVVDDRPEVGVAPEEGEEVVEMERKPEGVEGEVEVDEGSVGPLHVAPQHPVRVREVLDHGAHRGELRMAGEPFQMPAMLGVLEVHPPDDGGGRPGRVRDPEQVLRLLDARGGLHHDGRLDPVPFEAGGEVGRAVAAVEDRVARLHPVVVAAPGLPVVVVRVDPHRAIHFLLPSAAGPAGAFHSVRAAAVRSERRGGGAPAPSGRPTARAGSTRAPRGHCPRPPAPAGCPGSPRPRTGGGAETGARRRRAGPRATGRPRRGAGPARGPLPAPARSCSGRRGPGRSRGSRS